MKIVKRITILIIILFSISNCSTTKKRLELSKEELKNLNYISLHKKYKFMYPKLFPYLYNNSKNNFSYLIGDFYNVKLSNGDNLNLLCNLHNKKKNNNSIKCMIRKTSTSKIDLFKSNISIKSSKNGEFTKKTLLNKNRSFITHPAIEFIKELNVEKPKDIINKIRNDTIIITINNQIFEFISPEM
jgi:hypothetical protein